MFIGNCECFSCRHFSKGFSRPWWGIWQRIVELEILTIVLLILSILWIVGTMKAA